MIYPIVLNQLSLRYYQQENHHKRAIGNKAVATSKIAHLVDTQPCTFVVASSESKYKEER